MESIIIFVLIAIATSVFQSVTQGSKQQHKQQTPNTMADVPRMQPTVQPMNQPKVQKNNSPDNKQSIQVVKPKVQKPKVSSEPAVQQMSMQRDTFNDAVVQERKAEQTSNTATSPLEEITLSDMQRSIVMAEILGKPVALRKSIR